MENPQRFIDFYLYELIDVLEEWEQFVKQKRVKTISANDGEFFLFSDVIMTVVLSGVVENGSDAFLLDGPIPSLLRFLSP